MADYLEVCETAARAGGQVLRDWAGRFAVREKGPADLVTEADLASQETIREIVLKAFPSHGFLGEEGGGIPAGPEGFRWIVDPLDGTSNYVHGLAYYSVSVALECQGELLAGAVYDPVIDHMFSAAAGQPAHRNGETLQVSRCTRMDDAMVAASLAARLSPDHQEMRDFVAVTCHCQTIRRLGSAALNLCHVASGNLDAYWAISNQPWDIAAGFLIARQAGAVITELDGGPVDLARPRFIAASSEPLRAELQAILAATRTA
ncbi:MAG: inositol monophosphatase [Pirellulales bacterium]|nr:inositol monophosphatase [Pirellulales bacterium]